MVDLMNVAYAILALTFPCTGLLIIAWLGRISPAFSRWCDVLFRYPTHRGRL